MRTCLTLFKKEFKTLNPTAAIQRTKYSQVNPKDVLNIQAFELSRVLDFDPEFLETRIKNTSTILRSLLSESKSKEMSIW